MSYRSYLGSALALLLATSAYARDLGQWETVDPEVSMWFKTLKQPDNPIMSCCGEADAYWADDVKVEGDKVYAIITDDRPDAPLGRQHIDVGTKILVPPNKITRKDGNPTGHTVIFLSSYMHDVYCYVMNGGV